MAKIYKHWIEITSLNVVYKLQTKRRFIMSCKITGDKGSSQDFLSDTERI